MLMNKISEDFEKISKILSDMRVTPDIGIINFILFSGKKILPATLIPFSSDVIELAKVSGRLEFFKFESRCARETIRDFLRNLDGLFGTYDFFVHNLNIENGNDVEENNNKLNEYAKGVYDGLIKLNVIGPIFKEASKEVWEPLPFNTNVNKVENIIIQSESRSVSLFDVAKDIQSIDSFLNSICFLLEKDKNNCFYLRKIETGSLSIVVSSVIGVSNIVALIFMYIKLCQQTERRFLSNEEKKLELVNKNLDIAKQILEIQPDNAEANETIQIAALYILEYLKNNPRGSINGKKYDTGMEDLRIEQKE